MNETIDNLQDRTSDYPQNPEQLEEVLEAHRKWVETKEKEGKRAELRGFKLEATKFPGKNLLGANLEEADLQGADLREANLMGANLRGANLQGVNLRGASLFGANLQKARLQKAIMLPEANRPPTNMQETKLQNAHLQEAKLQGTDLLKANLHGANLREANLRKAHLTGADLQETTLLRTILRDAVLQDADLTDATGLLAGQLGGANVSGAKMPEAIRQFEELAIVEEACKNARKIFVSMLLGCVYSWLTVATTTDARLLTNSASSPLPIIGAEIPIVGFYWAAPLLLLGICIYFHLYLQHLWEMLANLPAVFPDGRPLDERAYPWLLNGLVRAHFVLLRDKRPPLSRMQVGISILLAWWVAPATLLLFWGRYLPRHDWIGTLLHIILLVSSIGFGIASYSLAKATLRGKKRQPLLRKEAWRDTRIYKHAAATLGIGAILCFLSFGAINGIPPDLYKDDLAWTQAPKLNGTSLRRWVPHAFALVGCKPFVNLEEVDVSSKPANWTGQEEKAKDEIALVKGARLKDRNLRYAKAYRVFLIKADLRRANLLGTCLAEADLRGANLWKAILQQADLSQVKLQKADLREVYLRGANLRDAELQEVNLRGADLLDIRNWQDIRNMKLANIHGVKNPPKGFIKWATDAMSAVSICSDEEWEALKEKARMTNDNTVVKPDIER